MYKQKFPKGFVTPEKIKLQIETFSNTLRKHFRHFWRKFKREGIECFRLYDWDAPDIRIVVDWYAGHLVVAEYERLQTGPEYLPQMAAAAASVLNVAPDKVYVRRRHTNTSEGPRYTKIDSRGARFEVRERNLRFWVNLSDFLDTGLYSDHRNTRVIIEKLAPGKDFLNLFAYTGAFSCAAAKGGAKSTVTVDRSRVYLDWAKDNLALNGINGQEHKLVRSDAITFLYDAYSKRQRFTLAFVDPPSFFKDESARASFDINRDHPELIRNVLKIMHPGSDLFFSTNHQRFEPRFDGITVKQIIKLTPKTIPEDYRNRNAHNCWHIKV